MATTFDNDIASFNGVNYIDRIITIRDTGGVATGDYEKATEVDFFTDDAGVGDYVCFGWEAGVWHDLKVNIGTPLVADSIEVIWEYSDSLTTWDTLSVTDGTNAFQNSGVQTVAFDIPDGWQSGNQSPYPAGWTFTIPRKYWIRARIVSVTNLTEGGANTTDYITGKDYSVMITGTGNTPATIYASGVAGSLMTKTGSFYHLQSHLRIGDYSTHTDFTIQQCTLQVGDADNEGTRRSVIAQNDTDEWYMGSDEYGGQLGGSFIYYANMPRQYYNYWSCKCYWYNSFYEKPYGSYNNGSFRTGIKVIHNCIFSNQSICFMIGLPAGSEFHNCILEMNTTATYWYIYTDIDIDNLTLTKGPGILTTAASVVKNVSFRDKNFRSYYSRGAGLLNCSMDDYDTQITDPVRDDADVSVWFTYDMNIIDTNGDTLSDCHVKIESGEGVIFDDTWTTSIDARIWYKERVDGTSTIYTYNPFTITITKDGYQTYSVTREITEQVNDTICLKKTPTATYLLDINP